MSAMPADTESATGKKWSFITVSSLGAGLIIASIWFLSHSPNNSSPRDAATPAAPVDAATPPNNVLSYEEIEKEAPVKMEEQETAPLVAAPVAAQPTAIQTKQKNDAVKLQKVKANVNQRIADRMKQYIKDNPNIDSWEIKEQIKKRENQGAKMK
jgi:hypothetical protein